MMLSVIFTSVAAIILVAGIVFSQRTLPLDDYLPEPNETEMFDNSQQPHDELMNENSSNNTQVSISENNSDINIEITDSPSDVQTENDLIIEDFRYQGSEVIVNDQDSLTLSSEDDPEAITDWYEDKLESYDMNVNSFVSTSTNDTVKNELVSSNGKSEIRILIQKDQEDSLTFIEIKLISS